MKTGKTTLRRGSYFNSVEAAMEPGREDREDAVVQPVRGLTPVAAMEPGREDREDRPVRRVGHRRQVAAMEPGREDREDWPARRWPRSQRSWRNGARS